MDFPGDEIEPVRDNNSLRMLEEDQKNTLAMLNSNQYSRVIDFYYVSDLHIDNKLWKMHPGGYEKEETEKYVEESVDRIIPPKTPETEFNNRPIAYGGLVLLCGDVALKTDVLKVFLKKFSKRVQEYSGTLVFIEGNHERTHVDPDNPSKNVDICIVEEDYRKFCRSHDIIFLHNELLLFDGRYSMILDTQSILNSSDIQLAEVCSHSDALIFGGTGFQMKDPYYGLTKDVQLTDEVARDYAKDVDTFKRVYQKLLDVFKNDDRVMVVTHFPPGAWIEDSVNPNWIYFHGHTHQDNFVFNDQMKIFGDNQWGHDGTRDGLKHYRKGFRTDIFSHLGDGIYKITREKYLTFQRHLGIYCDMNRKVQILMLKREGFYLFLYEDDRKRLKLLEGGRTHPLEKETLVHVYDNMVYMAQKMLGGTLNIRKHMAKVSDYVRGFGGNGNIHGCIVDIDFWNHLYVNPFDGTITPYHATDMVNKIVYPNINLLLQNHVPELTESYEKKASSQKSLVKINGAIRASPKGTPYKETDIYAISNRLRNIQYMADCNIIRYWVPDEVTDANRSDRTMEITDYDALVEGWPMPKKPFTLSSESYACRSRVRDEMTNALGKGQLSEKDVRNVISESCRGMWGYDDSEIDTVIDTLYCEILSSLKDSKIVLSEGTPQPAIAEKVEEPIKAIGWKEIYEALHYLELDFSDKLLEFLQTAEGESLSSVLEFKPSGKRNNDLKKIYREFFLGNKGGTFIREVNGKFSFFKPGREDVNELVDAYLEGRLATEIPRCEKIVCPARYYPDIYRTYGFDIISAFSKILRINQLSEVEWFPDVLKLLCASIIRTQYDEPETAEYLGSYLYSENSEFDRRLGMFTGDSVEASLSEAWILLLVDESAIAYLLEHAKVYHV